MARGVAAQTRNMRTRAAASQDTMQVTRRGPLGQGRRDAKPPGPREFPVVGTSTIFTRNQLEAIRGLVIEHGDLVSYKIGPQPICLLTNPDDIHQVLVTEQSKFMKGALTHELSRFMGRGLVTSEGKFWRRQRKIAAPSFTKRHIQKFADTMVERSWSVAQTLDDGPRDVHADMMELALQIVLHTVFGDAEVPDTRAVAPLVGTLLEEFHHVYLTWRRLLPMALKRDPMERQDKAGKKLDALFYSIIRARREDENGYGDDLLGRLLSARDDSGTGMTDLQVRDEVATLFLAGHETTALALSFALLLLARNPKVQTRLREEIDGVLGKRRACMDDVAELPYTDAVIKEAMRILPPVYMFGREALEDLEIGGWWVRRGTQVLMPVWTIHRDERWYEDPLVFRPERWLDGLADRLPKHAYMPFGGGPRVCVGNHFAILSAIMGLVTLMQTHEVSEVNGFELDLMTSVTLRPRGGVRVRLDRREPHRAANGRV